MTQTILKIPAIDFLVRLTVGPQVLKKAQRTERATTRRNWAQGKKGGTVACKNKLNCKSIV